MAQVTSHLAQVGTGCGTGKKARFYRLGTSGTGKSLNLKYAREGSRWNGSHAHTHAWVKIQAFYLCHLCPAPFHGHLRDRLTCARPVPDLCHLSSEVSL